MLSNLLHFLSRGLNFLPSSFRIVAGALFGRLWFHVFRFRRGVVEENIRKAFGREMSTTEVRRIASQNFEHYGKTILETVASVSWTREDYLQQVTLHGLEHLQRYTDQGTGGFILTGHFGNWEMAISATAAAGIPIDVVVKRSPNPEVEAFLREHRRRTGAGLMVETGTARDILRSVSRGRFVAFVLDQFMGPPIGLPVTFFGQRAGTAVSLALLTEKRTEPVIPSYSYRDSENRLHTVFEPALALNLPNPEESKVSRLYRKTQAYNDVLERFVRRAPEQWLWLHKRWKAYRGEPRWVREPGQVQGWILALSLFGLAACAGTRVATPTGIEIPPDAKVAIPTFSLEPEADDEDEAELAAATVQAKAEAPMAPKKPAPATKPGARAVKPAKTEGYKVVDAERIPFELGERMEIDLNWMAIPAGRASIEVLNGPAFQDRPTFLLRGNVLSSKVVDAIYHVDNTIESYVDKTGLIPYKFLLHMVETHQKKETRVSFDQVQKKAHYWAQRISQKWGNELNDRIDDMKPSSQDMFSALYFARTLNYRMGVKRTIPVFENRQNLDVELLPVGNEFVRTPAGYFQCWKLSVTVKINNILKPNGDIFLWLSDDSKRYIVKFDAKLKVGSLIGTLVQVKPRGG